MVGFYMLKFSIRKYLIVLFLFSIASVLLSSPNGNSKNYAAADPLLEDLRLRIEIVYTDADLVQHEDPALSPTTVTTASTTKFRAKGGTSNYTWRLVPAETSDASISPKTGADITYRAGSSESRSFDVLIVNDGLEEVSLNIVVAKARLKSNGTGSKGSGCFLKHSVRN